MSIFSGLAQGLQTGHGIAMQRQQMQMQQQNNQLQQKMAQFQFDRLQDKQELETRRNNIHQLRYRMGNMRKRADAGEMPSESEVSDLKKYQIDTLNSAFPEAIGTGGRKKISDIVPVGQDRFALELDVDGAGKVPMTQNRTSDPNDPVMTMGKDDLYEYLSQAEQALEEALIASGDYSPIQAQQAAQQATAAAQADQAKYDREQAGRLEVADRAQAGRVALADREQAGRMKLEGARHSNDLALQGAKHDANISLEQIKRDAKAAAPTKGVWSAQDIEKHIPTTLAKVMAPEGGLQDWDKNQQEIYASAMKSATTTALQKLQAGQPVNVNQIVSDAYRQAVGGAGSSLGIGADVPEEQAEQGPGLMSRITGGISGMLGSIQGRDAGPSKTWQAMPPADQQQAMQILNSDLEQGDQAALKEFIEAFGFDPTK